MYRMAVLAVLALAAASCNWFVPDGRIIEIEEQFSGGDTMAMVRYVFEPAETDPREDLARCLTERGVVLYSTPWCGACVRQKQLFGPFASLLNEVDCTQESQRCNDANIRAVPTWVFSGGSHHEGIRTLRQLARRARCPYRSR